MCSATPQAAQALKDSGAYGEATNLEMQMTPELTEVCFCFQTCHVFLGCTFKLSIYVFSKRLPAHF